MNPNEAAKRIGTELGQSNPRGDARLAEALAQPTTQHTEVLCVKDHGSMWPTLYVEGTSVRVGDVEGTSATGGNAVATAHRLALCWNSHADLLEACKSLVLWANDPTEQGYNNRCAAVSSARSAIAKATPPNVPPVSP